MEVHAHTYYTLGNAYDHLITHISNWSYSGEDGPSKWTGTCASGRRQSPINVDSNKVVTVTFDKLNFQKYSESGKVKMENNGHTGNTINYIN